MIFVDLFNIVKSIKSNMFIDANIEMQMQA